MNNSSFSRQRPRFSDSFFVRWLRRLLLLVGLVTVLAVATPIDYWWARAYAGPIVQPKGDVLILLSAANDDEGFISYSSYWRARAALFAWKTGGFKTLVITGGGGPGIRDFLIVEGVPRDAIIAEWKSTSTRQNGLNTALLVREMPGRKVLLTSDFHMYRSVRVFRKLGVDVVPDPAPDVMKISKNWNERFSGFESMAIETTKIVYYRMRGWI